VAWQAKTIPLDHAARELLHFLNNELFFTADVLAKLEGASLNPPRPFVRVEMVFSKTKSYKLRIYVHTTRQDRFQRTVYNTHKATHSVVNFVDNYIALWS
jgi:hypothetical protein